MQHRMLTVIAFAGALVAAPAMAQTHTGGNQNGGSNAMGAGQANPGGAAGDMQRTNPPTTSNAPGNLSGAQPQGSNTGSSTMPANQGATTSGRTAPEVPRADSAR